MGQQSIRQEARRTALDAQSKRRQERACREKRLENLAVRVLVAVRERNVAVAAAERRAGKALREMTQDEGLSVREAVHWCGDAITPREASRLRRLVDNDQVGGSEVDDDNPAAVTPEAVAWGSFPRTHHGAAINPDK